MNELIRELVEALEYSSDFLSSASRFGRRYRNAAEEGPERSTLKQEAGRPVEDGLPESLG